jgi:CheY-like chemotaxis protein
MKPIESAGVLLVDDSVTNAELTMHALKVDGVSPRITWVCDPEEALFYMFRTQNFVGRELALPRLVLLDVDMPGMGGMQVLERLKRDPRTKIVPIVILSSRHDSTIVRRCFELGANSYLVKPITAVDYFREIATVAQYWLTFNADMTEERPDDLGRSFSRSMPLLASESNR